MITNAIDIAIEKCNMPKGVFLLIQKDRKFVGEYLVKHPKIKAVGFIGSFKVGKAVLYTSSRRAYSSFCRNGEYKNPYIHFT